MIVPTTALPLKSVASPEATQNKKSMRGKTDRQENGKEKMRLSLRSFGSWKNNIEQDKVNYAVSEMEDRVTDVTTIKGWRAVLECTGLYWTVLGCTGLYWAVLGCARLYLALVEMKWAVLYFTGLFWTGLGCTELYWAVLGCTGMYWDVLGGTRLYRAVPGCTLLYFAVLGCTWMY